jgi:hypothetical protein
MTTGARSVIAIRIANHKLTNTAPYHCISQCHVPTRPGSARRASVRYCAVTQPTPTHQHPNTPTSHKVRTAKVSLLDAAAKPPNRITTPKMLHAAARSRRGLCGSIFNETACQNRGVMALCQLTSRFSGRTMCIGCWHLIPHGPLQPVVMRRRVVAAYARTPTPLLVRHMSHQSF